MDKDDPNFNDYAKCLNKLLQLHLLNNLASGITKLVIDKGVSVLSSKQKSVFDINVTKKYCCNKCVRCGEIISWNEMINIIEDDEKLCSQCLNFE